MGMSRPGQGWGKSSVTVSGRLYRCLRGDFFISMLPILCLRRACWLSTETLGTLSNPSRRSSRTSKPGSKPRTGFGTTFLGNRPSS